MENLYFQFYAAPPNSQEAMALEDSIINISLCYGIISPFTSFEDNSGGGATSEVVQVDHAVSVARCAITLFRSRQEKYQTLDTQF